MRCFLSPHTRSPLLSIIPLTPVFVHSSLTYLIFSKLYLSAPPAAPSYSGGFVSFSISLFSHYSSHVASKEKIADVTRPPGGSFTLRVQLSRRSVPPNLYQCATCPSADHRIDVGHTFDNPHDRKGGGLVFVRSKLGTTTLISWKFEIIFTHGLSTV